MKKICIISVFLVALLALATCKQPMAPDGGDSSGGGTPITPPSSSFSGVNKFVAISNGNSGKIKGSFKSGGLEYYYIYLGQLENIPLYYGPKYYHSSELGNYTYTYTKAKTDTISNTVTESSSQAVSVSEMHTKTTTSETTLKAEASVKYKGLGVTAEAKASAEQKWKTYTEDTSGFQRDTSFTNTVMYGSSKAETTQESMSITLTERQREGHYRFTFFSVSDVYVWVIKDPAQPGALDLEFKEYINPKEFVWRMDYTDPGNPGFDKTDDTKFQLALSFLDSLPPVEVDLDYVEGISYLDKTTGLEEGKTYPFIAEITPVYATNKNVTWSSSNPAVATVSNTGVVTGVKAGTAIITVTAQDKRKGTFTDTCTVAVSDAVIPVTDINPKNSSVSLYKDGTTTLSPIFSPPNATNQKHTWTSSDTAIATVSNGKVTALKVGTTTITATADDKTNGEKKATWNITVSPVKVTGVTLATPASLNLDFPDKLDHESTASLVWKVTPDEAENKAVSWKSSNDAVATVSDGLVTAKGVGSVTIFVTTADGGFQKSVDLTVRGTKNVTTIGNWTDVPIFMKQQGNGTANNPKQYVIKVSDNIAKITGATTNTFGDVSNVVVRLTGEGVLELGSNGRVLTIGASQTVIIDGPTLQGKSGNNGSLVRVEGTLELKKGSITNNTLTTPHGAGVYVGSSGRFLMDGGNISKNRCDYSTAYGGGVYIANGGTFRKSGGTIYGKNGGDYKNSVKSGYGDAICWGYPKDSECFFRNENASESLNMDTDDKSSLPTKGGQSNGVWYRR